jgi:hypothetical protein
MPIPSKHGDLFWPWLSRTPELQRIVNEALEDVRLDFSDPIRSDVFGGTDTADITATLTNGSPYLLRCSDQASSNRCCHNNFLAPQWYFVSIGPNESRTWTIRIQAQNLTGQTQNPQVLQAYFTGSVSAEVVPMAVDTDKGYKTVDVGLNNSSFFILVRTF